MISLFDPHDRASGVITFVASLVIIGETCAPCLLSSRQSLIDSTQKKVNGQVKLKVFKGNVIILGRKSDDSLYDNSLVSFDEVGDYNQKDAEGFIKVNSVRLKKSNL